MASYTIILEKAGCDFSECKTIEIHEFEDPHVFNTRDILAILAGLQSALDECGIKHVGESRL